MPHPDGTFQGSLVSGRKRTTPTRHPEVLRRAAAEPRRMNRPRWCSKRASGSAQALPPSPCGLRRTSRGSALRAERLRVTVFQ